MIDTDAGITVLASRLIDRDMTRVLFGAAATAAVKLA